MFIPGGVAELGPGLGITQNATYFLNLTYIWSFLGSFSVLLYYFLNVLLARTTETWDSEKKIK